MDDAVNPGQMLFGINQGTVFARPPHRAHEEDRRSSDCDGYAIGGLAVGEPHQEMYDIIEAVEPYMPKDKPRYLMGVGTPSQHHRVGVARGVDFFDCVMPARNGAARARCSLGSGVINIKNEKYAAG